MHQRRSWGAHLDRVLLGGRAPVRRRPGCLEGGNIGIPDRQLYPWVCHRLCGPRHRLCRGSNSPGQGRDTQGHQKERCDRYSGCADSWAHPARRCAYGDCVVIQMMQGQTGAWGAAAFLVVWLILRFFLRRTRRRGAARPRRSRKQATLNTLPTMNGERHRRSKRQ